MKVELWAIGKTNEKYLETGIEIFEKRLSHYLPFKFMILPDVKTKLKDPELLKTEEGKMLLARLQPDDHLVLLDENGKEKALFSGDTLFIGDVGRPDLAQKAAHLTQEQLAETLFDSLRNKVMPLPDDVIVYPAHGAGSDDARDLELHCHVLDYCRFGIAARRVGGSDLPLFDKAVREFVKLP